MKCNRCGKEIEESEIFCSDCKKVFRNISSRSEVKELEDLIENQKRLTDLENTKELVNLDNLVKEELEIVEDKEETKTLEIENDVEYSKEENKKEEKQPKNKKKLIIIISIVSIILIIVIILLFIFLGKDEKEKKVIIDYEKVINDYGDSITKIVDEYIETNEDIPTWQYINQNVNYNKHEVNCSTHNIYSDGSIYLANCKVDNKKIKYTYGKELEEVKEGKKIEIYKQNNNGNIIYSNNTTGSLVGTITCKTEACEYISAYDNYVLIKEDNKYYLYDYTNNSINFGPFLLNSQDDILVTNNTLYGIIYKEENITNIYSVQAQKVLENIKGTLYTKTYNLDPSIMYKYNYVIINNEGRNDFINLKTGNVSYTISENISEFIESDNIIYIITYTNDINKYKIYNSNGKLLFGGEEYTRFIIDSNNILLSTDNTFKVYDKDLKLKTNSKVYDEVLGLYKDFVVVSKDSNLMILDINDKVLTIYKDVWNNDCVFYEDLSKKDNKVIYIVVENKKIPLKAKGRYIEYYYNLSTKEGGFTEKSSI